VAILVAPISAQNHPPNLTDPEVAHVAVTANSIDIELGKLALTKATSPAVKAFAQSMVEAHTAVNARAGDLARKLGVTPADNAVSQGLRQGAVDARAGVEKLSGGAFDRAYIDREIAYHQAVLGALDGVLIPTTENTELRRLLVEVRPAIEAHLAHAKQVRQGLANGQ
jgi:putative membrane protein